MIALIRDLGATDPGALFAIGILLGAALGVTVLVIGFVWDSRPQVPSVSRPVSSSRKSGRTS